MGAVCGCGRATAISSPWPQESRQESVERQTQEPESAETQNGGSGPVSEEPDIHEIRALTGACEVPQKLEVAEANSRHDNNKRVMEARRARVKWLEKLQKESASQQEFDTARSHSVWTQIDSSACSSSSCAPYGPSPEALERIREKNRLHFQHLVDTQPSPAPFAPFAKKEVPSFEKLSNSQLSSFFADFGGRLKAGQKIGGGAQADIHKAIYNGEVLEWCVLKVFRIDVLLTDLQRTWTKNLRKNMRHYCRGWSAFPATTRRWNYCGIKHGTLLQDGRFAFVLQRCWGDLRKAIDLKIVKDMTHSNPPFSQLTVRGIIVSIARGMAEIHQNGIIHKDLKAANCLLLYNPNDILPQLNHCVVGDFESSEGVEGTRFWRAPEILLALRNKKRGIYSTEKIWTEAADVYSYAMTCYEVLTGCTPFEDCATNDYDGVIGGERPPLPDYIEPKLQELLRSCWHNKPDMRPSFVKVQHMLKDIYPRDSIGFPTHKSRMHDSY